MKTSLTLTLVVLFLITACSKEGNFTNDTKSPNSGVMNLKDGQCGEVIKVASPNGTDDTQSILDAFAQAEIAGPGSVVLLDEGTYTIGFIEVHDFIGYFVGAGKGKTIITNKPDLLCDPLYDINKLPSLLKFIGGDFTMTHMTVKIKDGNPCVTGGTNDLMIGDLMCVLLLSDYSADYVPDDRQIKGRIEDIDFLAGTDGGYGVYGTEGNVNMAILFGADVLYFAAGDPLSTGNVTITGCSFENCNAGPDIFGLDDNSVLKIERNTISGGMQPIFIGGCMGPRVSIKGNRIYNPTLGGIFIDAYDYGIFPGQLPETLARFTIEGNLVKCAPGAVGIYLRDYYRTSGPATVPPQIFNVYNNTIVSGAGTMATHLFFDIRDDATAIQCLDARDATIWNNKFLGSGTSGIYIDGDEASGTYAENIKMMGNRFLNTDYSTGNVYLGPYSRYCKVVGVAKEKVIDEGVDNTVTGARQYKPWPGEIHHPYNSVRNNMGKPLNRGRF